MLNARSSVPLKAQSEAAPTDARWSMLTPAPATKADVEAHFATHGTGEITEIKLMNGFGFIEYKDAMDARDVVPGKSTSSMPLFFLLPFADQTLLP
jgi:hypothetical protein